MATHSRSRKSNRHTRPQRAAGWAQANQPAMLSLELFIVTWLARVALGAAIASNYDKARWVVAHLSESGTWSPAALAGALELSFGISAYFLAARIQEPQRRWRDVLLLAFVTTLFAAISAVANVAYFVAHATTDSTWVVLQAIALGIAAPLVALANAVLSGELAGIAADHRTREAEAEAARQAQRAEQQAVAAQRQHEIEMARLALERTKETTAQERARDRQARRALELVQVREGTDGRPSRGQDTASGVQGRADGASGAVQGRTPKQSRMDAILSILEDDQGVTQRELAGQIGVSKSTVNSYLLEMAESGLLHRTEAGQYMPAGTNGNGAGPG